MVQQGRQGLDQCQVGILAPAELSAARLSKGLAEADMSRGALVPCGPPLHSAPMKHGQKHWGEASGLPEVRWRLCLFPFTAVPACLQGSSFQRRGALKHCWKNFVLPSLPFIWVTQKSCRHYLTPLWVLLKQSWRAYLVPGLQMERLRRGGVGFAALRL